MAAEKLLMYPSGFKAGKLYSQIPTDGVGDFTVIRAGNKTRRNSLNVTEVLSANVPSIDYTGGVTCPILLSEPQGTNLYLNSEVMITQDVTVAASKYTVSFYGTGTITFTGTHTGSLVGTGLNDLVSITFTPSAGTLTNTISGTVTEGQIELGSYASSRIITAGTSVTRLADVISGAGDVNIFSSVNESGVLFWECAALVDDETARYISVSDGTFNNRVLLGYTVTGTNSIRSTIKVANVTVASLVYQVSDITNYHKVAVRWKENDFSLWVDGVKRDTDLSGVIFTASTLISSQFDDRGDGTSPFYGKVRQNLISEYLTDEQMATLTT